MLLSVAMVKGKGSVTTCCGPYRKDFILNYLYCGKTANSVYYQTRLFSFPYTLFVTLVSKKIENRNLRNGQYDTNEGGDSDQAKGEPAAQTTEESSATIDKFEPAPPEADTLP
jgi:hypothetical protein